VFIIQLDPEHRAGENCLDTPFYFNVLFAHINIIMPPAPPFIPAGK
jgi:hypothetical protein